MDVYQWTWIDVDETGLYTAEYRQKRTSMQRIQYQLAHVRIP